MRRLFFKLHLYAALVAGIFIAILGLTGGIMAFEDDLFHVLHPHLSYVTPGPRTLSLAELAAAAAKAYPGERVSIYAFSVSPKITWSVGIPSGQVFMNQYTGEILGVMNGPDLLGRIHQLHIRLLIMTRFQSGPLAGVDIGKNIMGWACVLMLFLLLSGLYLWWPLKRVRIDWAARKNPSSGGWTRRIWFDVHNTVGIFSLVFLIILALTGLSIGFGGVSTPLIYRLTGAQPLDSNFKASPQPGASQISPGQALEIARAAMPGATPVFLNVAGPRGVYRIALRYPEDLTPGGRSRVYIDAYTSKVLQAESSRTTEAGQRTINAIRAIHTGDIFGMPSKIVLSLASLLAVAQGVTGLFMWWKRRG